MLVPDDIQDETHRVHLIPCYKKFTLILAGEQSNMWLSKRSWDGNSTWVYPEVCHFVRKDVSCRGKKVGLEKLDMKEAQWLIKQWPRGKDSK